MLDSLVNDTTAKQQRYLLRYLLSRDVSDLLVVVVDVSELLRALRVSIPLHYRGETIPIRGVDTSTISCARILSAKYRAVSCNSGFQLPASSGLL